jgi:hypothetical protein
MLRVLTNYQYMFIDLSDYERTLMADAELMRTKNRVIEKVVEMFEHVYEFYQPIAEQYLPQTLPQFAGKISKGEKYEGLPYVVLDYPRLFSRDNIFAIRSLFWWGNYMSVTLHVSGSYQEELAEIISTNITAGKLSTWHIQYSGDPWQHAVADPYQPVNNQANYQLAEAPFIKLAKKIPLAEWDVIDKLFIQSFSSLLQMFYAPMR